MRPSLYLIACSFGFFLFVAAGHRSSSLRVRIWAEPPASWTGPPLRRGVGNKSSTQTQNSAFWLAHSYRRSASHPSAAALYPACQTASFISIHHHSEESETSLRLRFWITSFDWLIPFQQAACYPIRIGKLAFAWMIPFYSIRPTVHISSFLNIDVKR